MNSKLVLGINQVLVKSETDNYSWIYDVDPEEFDYLKNKGKIDDDGNLVLSLPFAASLKKFSVNKVIESVDVFVKELNVPELIIEIEDRVPIDLDEITNSTNDQLGEYLVKFGAYKAYLETHLAVLDSKKSVLEASYEAGLDKLLHILDQKYRNETGKKPVKESLRGEAIALSPQLRQLKSDIIEIEAKRVRTSGIRESFKSCYDMTSRLISLRTSNRGDQV